MVEYSDGRILFRPKEERSPSDMRSGPMEPTQVKTPAGCSPQFAIRMQFRGREQTTVLPLTRT